MFDSLLKKAQENKLKTSIVGFGYIGECIGAVLAERGHDVTGIDVSEEAVQAFNAKTPIIAEPGLSEIVSRCHPEKIRATTDFSTLQESDFIVITVGTPIDENYSPITDYVVQASKSVAQYLRPGQAVVLKSTLPPLTTEEVVRPLLEESGLTAGKDFLLAFSPERIAEGTALQELREIPIVVGGINPLSTEIIEKIWQSLLDVETIGVSSPRTAETVKLADNAFIDLNIALANEFAMVCDKINADAMEVIRGANSLKKGQHYVNVLYPSVGVGGTCLTKDPWFVHEFGRRNGLELNVFSAGRNTNEKMPTYAVNRLEHALGGLRDKTVGILGLSFKANTGDLRFTPVMPFIDALKERKAQFKICDPRVHTAELRKECGNLELQDLSSTISQVDAIAVLSPHDEFTSMNLSELKKTSGASVFLDGRNAFQRKDAEDAGFEYIGIGR